MNITANYQKVINTIPKSVKLIIVSKRQENQSIKEVFEAGHVYFGENKVQELTAKKDLLPSDIQWHFIGHLQTNKVKFIAPFVKLIHSVDSLKLLMEINKEALKNNRVIDCLLEFHIAEEDSKYGLTLSDATHLLDSTEFSKMHNIRICGLMGMATFTDDEKQVREEFKKLKKYFEEFKATYFLNNSDFKEISMGMSDDYLWAIKEGSTMVRIGSAIFRD